MKDTDFIKQLDPVGRVVVPKELRDKLMWKSGDPIEFYVESNSLVLKKSVSGCVFCGGTSGLISFMGNNVCAGCAAKLSALQSGQEE